MNRVIRYTFEFLGEGAPAPRAFEVRLEDDTFLDLEPLPATAPAWTALAFQQCPNCPLSAADVPLCPTAARLVPLLEAFADVSSFDRAVVRVELPERTVSKETTLSAGLSALLGLKMATSDCPVLDRMRPMARFHLPFASEEDNLMRTLSSYLIAQFLRGQAGLPVDWSLSGLKESAKAVSIVNKAFSNRMRIALTRDASANALVRLDLLAKSLPLDLADWLSRYALTFAAWLKR